MYSGEYDACDVTLSVYPHRVDLKNMPGHGGIRKKSVARHIFPGIFFHGIRDQAYFSVARHIFPTESHQTRFVNCFDSNNLLQYCPPPSGEKFEMFVYIRCPIRVECILSCSTTSASLRSKPGTRIYFGQILSFPHGFRANLSSLIKASLF